MAGPGKARHASSVLPFRSRERRGHMARKSTLPHAPHLDNGAPDAVVNAQVDSRKEGATTPEPDTTFDTATFDAQPAPAAAQVLDPFDPQTYRAAPGLSAAAGVKDHLTELSVTTPNAAWWVRRHPDENYSLV